MSDNLAHKIGQIQKTGRKMELSGRPLKKSGSNLQNKVPTQNFNLYDNQERHQAPLPGTLLRRQKYQDQRKAQELNKLKPEKNKIKQHQANSFGSTSLDEAGNDQLEDDYEGSGSTSMDELEADVETETAHRRMSEDELEARNEEITQSKAERGEYVPSENKARLYDDNEEGKKDETEGGEEEGGEEDKKDGGKDEGKKDDKKEEKEGGEEKKDEEKKGEGEKKDEKDGKKDEEKKDEKEKNGSEKKDDKEAKKNEGGGKQKPDPGVEQKPIKSEDKEDNKGKEKGAKANGDAGKAQTVVQAQNAARNVAQKAAQGDISGAAEEVVSTGTKTGSQYLLTAFWGSVWEDWTLLSLLYLNLHLAGSIILPQYICQFGEDYLIGKFIPPQWSKMVEILLLAILDIIIIALIAAILFIIYVIVMAITHPIDTLKQFGFWNVVSFIFK